MGNKQLVLNTLFEAGKPLKNRKISDLSELAKKDADKAMFDLKTKGKILSTKRYFWQAK